MGVFVAWTSVRFLVLVSFIYNSGCSCFFGVYKLKLQPLPDLPESSCCRFCCKLLEPAGKYTRHGGGCETAPHHCWQRKGWVCSYDFNRFIWVNYCVERIILQSKEVWQFILAQGSVSTTFCKELKHALHAPIWLSRPDWQFDERNCQLGLLLQHLFVSFWE